jgi:hypothetical protein
MAVTIVLEEVDKYLAVAASKKDSYVTDYATF